MTKEEEYISGYYNREETVLFFFVKGTLTAAIFSLFFFPKKLRKKSPYGLWWWSLFKCRSHTHEHKCRKWPLKNKHLRTVQISYLRRSKYLGSGWLYQKTKGTLWSPTSRDLSDSTVGSPLNSTRKKVTETKVEKIPKRHPENGIFHPMISWVYNNHCVILILHSVFLWANIKEKNLLQNVPQWLQNQSKWSILMASFWQQFSHNKHDFWLKQTIPEKFYIFWGWDEQKFLQLSLTVLIHERNALTWSANFFALNFI